ncbi:hypothetical protein [Serratia entomophila]|uniref:hypothetical protein n=1 Tax=Serratia entomophila TaxID=42906 RepID=UPI00217B6A5A|nr:hypothetical protein [Serratia entomophila]CAI0824098.1 Uncharacterised protein [Serratia entomophila]CAI1660709.1 Uncharacterised protein [Serratia entomophila]CAI1783397.1 Uncharacterised protein [Serratia entomophila]CAI1921487.1 Uncharacterised protein [Serratia entomophila]
MPLNATPGVNAPGNDYDRLSQYGLPPMVPTVNAGLVGAYFPAMLHKAGAVANRAVPANPMTNVGRPDLFASWSHLNRYNCFDVGMQTTSNPTYYVIAKPAPEGTAVKDQGLILSDWTNESTPAGLAVQFVRTAGNVRMTVYLTRTDGSNSQVNATIPAYGTDEFYVLLISWKDGAFGGAGIYNPATNLVAVASLGGTPHQPTGRNLRLGGHYNVSPTSDFSGYVDVAGLIIYNNVTHVDATFSAVGNYCRNIAGPQLGIWKTSV